MLKGVINILKEDKKLVFLLLISSLIRIVFAFNPLMNGEAYYARGVWDLQWGYFDQPPLFFWISGFFVKLFGYNNLALRFSSILFFALTTLLLYKITLDIFKNKRAAFFSVLALNISAVFSLSFAIFSQPDAIFIFFWLLSFHAVYKLFFPAFEVKDLSVYKNSKYVLKWWLIFGIAFGLGAISKYNIAFLGFGVFMFCIFNKNQRHWFLHYGPYLSILISLIIFIPVLYWNAQNDWISFVFQSSRAGATETSLRWDWFFRSISGQILWLLPWVWVPLVVQMFIVLRNKNKFQSYGLIAWLTFPTIIFFTVVTLWSDLVYHFHWQTPGYLMLFIPLGAWLDSKTERYGKAINRTVTATVIFSLALFAVLVIHINTGFWTSYGPKWLSLSFNQKNDPTIYCYKFDALKDKFEERGWMNDSNVFVGSSIWWLSGLVDYAFKGEKDFMLITNEPRNYAFLLDPNKMLGKNCVVVSHDNFVTGGNDQISPFFEKVELVDSTFIERYEEENELKLYFFYCTYFKKPAKTMWKMPLYAQLHQLPPFELLMNKPLEEENIWTETKDVIHTSFEYKNEHYRPYSIVSNEKYTGNFSCVLDAKNDYSLTVRKLVSPLKKMEISFMAKAKDSVNMVFVAVKNKWWVNEKLKDKIIPNGEWQKIKLEIVLPENQNNQDTLSLFFWDNSYQYSPLYIDDVEYKLISK